MDIYKRLPLDLQYLINIKMRQDYASKHLMPRIIDYRRKFLRKILHIQTYDLFSAIVQKIIMDDEDVFCSLVSCPLVNTTNDKNMRIYNFFQKIIPKLEIDYPVISLYNHYSSLDNKGKSNLIKIATDHLSIEVCEDIYNWVIYNFYNKKVNKSPLTITSVNVSNLCI